jgi:hypothetical protein
MSGSSLAEAICAANCPVAKDAFEDEVVDGGEQFHGNLRGTGLIPLTGRRPVWCFNEREKTGNYPASLSVSPDKQTPRITTKTSSRRETSRQNPCGGYTVKNPLNIRGK